MNKTTEDRLPQIAHVLRSHGEMFYGSDEYESAGSWVFEGFTASQVDAWCRVAVWDASTAAAFRDAKMTPAKVKATAERMVEADGADAYTSGCPIYAACNGDIDPQRIVKAYRNG